MPIPLIVPAVGLGAAAWYFLFRKKPIQGGTPQAAAANQVAPGSGGGKGSGGGGSAKPAPTPGVPQVGTLPGQATPPGTPDPTTATVSTHDPAPAGDLTIHSSPNGPTIGAADKASTVSVLTWNGDGANGWAKVMTTAGRHPVVTGYANRNYLAGNAAGTVVNTMVQAKAAEQDVADAGNAPATVSGEDDDFRVLIVTLPKPNARLKVRTGPAIALPCAPGGDPAHGGGVPNGGHVVASGPIVNGFVKIRFHDPSKGNIVGYAHSKFLLT